VDPVHKDPDSDPNPEHWFSLFYYYNSTFWVVEPHRFIADTDPTFYRVRTRIVL
jgi:hypothetical protein